MKKFFNLSSLFLATVLLFSCRDGNDIPKDIHEHEGIEKLVITLTNKNNTNDVQTINYITGVPDTPIHVHIGDVYNVELDFQMKYKDHYHSINDEIVKEKDEHFILYSFAGAEIKIKRATDDIIRSDGKRLGLKTEWTILNATVSERVNIRLVHSPISVNDNSPSSDNQLGSVVGGESDVDALFVLDIQ